MRLFDMNREGDLREARRLLPLLEGVIPYAVGEKWTVPAIAEELANERMQMWGGGQSVVLTQLLSYPPEGTKVLHVFMAVGTMGDVVGVLPTLEEWGRAHECEYLSILGRRGWVRVLAPRGFREIATLLGKELTDE